MFVIHMLDVDKHTQMFGEYFDETVNVSICAWNLNEVTAAL